MEFFSSLKLFPFFIVLSTLSLIFFFAYVFSIWKKYNNLYDELVPPQDIEDFKTLAKSLRKSGDKKH
jgi:hypothetical protein